MKKLSIVLLGIIIIVGCQPAKQETYDEPEVDKPSNDLVGTWWMDEWTYSGEDTSWHRTDLYGQFIFTDSYYSMLYVTQDGLRENRLKDRSWDEYSLEDLQKTLGMVIANSGHYKIENDTIIFTRDVALYPYAMAEGTQTSKWHIGTVDGDTWKREGEDWSVTLKRRQ